MYFRDKNVQLVSDVYKEGQRRPPPLCNSDFFIWNGNEKTAIQVFPETPVFNYIKNPSFYKGNTAPAKYFLGSYNITVQNQNVRLTSNDSTGHTVKYTTTPRQESCG